MKPNQTDTETVRRSQSGGTVASSALFGDVFVVVIEDRHCDTSVEVWTDREAAIASARALAKEYCRHQDDYHEETIQGWEFYVQYSCEGDSTRVVKTTVRQSPNAEVSQAAGRKGQNE